jgi:uncharacterized protein YjbI with pentapeptide repeats
MAHRKLAIIILLVIGLVSLAAAVVGASWLGPYLVSAVVILGVLGGLGSWANRRRRKAAGDEEHAGDQEPERDSEQGFLAPPVRDNRKSRWGFRGMTVQNWLELLIVPFVLAAFGLWFSAQQEARQREIEDQHTQAAAVQAYLDQMSTLLLDEQNPLRESDADSEVRTLARARTLSVLTTLESGDKRTIVKFLYEADLIQGNSPIVRLSEADLSEADLSSSDLGNANAGANLSAANMQYADLSSMDVSHADMSEADLRDADLGEARLREADLSEAKLARADLHSVDVDHADLSEANLSAANLKDAHLMNADLSDADLGSTNMAGADLSEANLRSANGITIEELQREVESLEGATAPNGLIYEDWLKSNGSGEDGENTASQ